jgi:hypothetical protein
LPNIIRMTIVKKDDDLIKNVAKEMIMKEFHKAFAILGGLDTMDLSPQFAVVGLSIKASFLILISKGSSH